MILVTGICGLTGRFLHRKIEEHIPSTEVRYLVRSSSDISWMKDTTNVIYGDLTNQGEIEKALKGVDQVVHLASIYHSENITKACINQGVRRVFYVNTTGMFSKYKAYAKFYIEFEEKIKASGLIYTIIRPTMIYGNAQDVNIHKLIKLVNMLPVFPVIGAGNGLMHPIYAEDLAKVISTAVAREETTRLREYNVAGKYPITYLNLLKEIAKALGKNQRFVHIPYKLALFIGKIGDYIPNSLIDYEKVQRLLEDKNFDYGQAIRDLDFHPISFAEGVKMEVKALQQAGIINCLSSK